MTTDATSQSCFNCDRTEMEIPIINWTYQKRPLSVCSECMPSLIHKWQQVVVQLPDRPPAESDK